MKDPKQPIQRGSPVPHREKAVVGTEEIGPMNFTLKRELRTSKDPKNIASRSVILACRKLYSNGWSRFNLNHFLHGDRRARVHDLDRLLTCGWVIVVGVDEYGALYSVTEEFVEFWYRYSV